MSAFRTPQLGWGEDGYEFPSEDDHVFCELEEEDVEPTDDPPTVEITAAEILARFRAINGEWDVQAAMERMGFGSEPVKPSRTKVVRIRSEACKEWGPCVEVPADASQDQLRKLALRVACLDSPTSLRPKEMGLTIEEVGPVSLRFHLGTKGKWHPVQEGDEAVTE